MSEKRSTFSHSAIQERKCSNLLIAWAQFEPGVVHIIIERLQMCGNIIALRSHPVNAVTMWLCKWWCFSTSALHICWAERTGDCRAVGWGEEETTTGFSASFSQQSWSSRRSVSSHHLYTGRGTQVMANCQLPVSTWIKTLQPLWFFYFFPVLQQSFANAWSGRWVLQTCLLVHGEKQPARRADPSWSSQAKRESSRSSPSCGTAVPHWMSVQRKGGIWSSRD